MMKRKHLTLLLVCFLWSLNSRAGLTVRFAGDLPENKTNLRSTMEKDAIDFWFAEETYWKVTPKDKELEIDFSLVSTEHLAQTRGGRVNFNVFLPADETDFALKHELAHVFFQTQCPKVDDLFTQELFAYWRSGDYIRYLHGNKKVFMKSQAYSSLKVQGPFTKEKTLAVARIVNELVKQNKESLLKDWFAKTLTDCNDVSFLNRQNKSALNFLEHVYAIQDNNVDVNNWGFLVFDAQANELIESAGKWDLKQPVGSTLKPFLFSYFTDLKKTKIKKDQEEWDCGEKNDVRWDANKALNYSCNGFFLETVFKKSEMQNYAHDLNSILGTDYQPRWLDMADVIGLWPTIQINLLDLAKVYDSILDHDPKTIDVLKNTAVKGTLAGAPESKWFVENQISLKSGTTTRLDLTIDRGFLVAVFKTSTAPKIAILYRAGRRPFELLGELKSKIKKYIEDPSPLAEVQVLSRFVPQSISISCSTILFKNGTAMSGNNLDFKAIGFSTATKYSCAGQPFDVKSPDNIPRKLYGEISFRRTDQVSDVESARSEKNARARKGSSLVLKTSESHYVKNVYFSEGGDFKKELKKALLLVIKSNLEFNRSKNRPICDTTLCQVFNLGYEAVSDSKKGEVNDLILELVHAKINSRSWLEFSLGGNQEWSQTVAKRDVREWLGRPDADVPGGQRIGDEFTFHGIKPVSCEALRSHFRLRSCPNSVTINEKGEFVFTGYGEGHGRGMNLIEANQLAQQGYSFNEIIQKFYGIEVSNYFK